MFGGRVAQQLLNVLEPLGQPRQQLCMLRQADDEAYLSYFCEQGLLRPSERAAQGHGGSFWFSSRKVSDGVLAALTTKA